MKNRFFALLLAVLLVFAVPAQAVVRFTPAPSASPTPIPTNTHKSKSDGCNVFSFLELYVERLFECKEKLDMELGEVGFSYGNRYSYLYPDPGESRVIHASCAAGSVEFSIDSLEIVGWSDLLFYADDDYESYAKHVYSCSIAISSLEFSDVDELYLKYFEKTTPVNKIMLDVMDQIFTNNTLMDKSFDSPVLVYEGKYSYYLWGSITTDGRKALYIDAE
ncbi:MAG: hypothetical protein IJP78_07620 [Clostridia bacterium]|nr:hypothetical protein [Clostridia bacterium]